MRKVLILAGMDISVDLLDPDIMKDVQDVLAKFDPMQ